MALLLAVALFSLTKAAPTNITLASASTAARDLGPKRGIVFGDGLQASGASLVAHASIGWIYDWAPDAVGLNPTGSQEFVPMLWTTYEQWDGARKARWDAAVQDNSRSKHLLGFNEPDIPIGRVGGSQLTVAEAVASWRADMQPHGLQQSEHLQFRLGSPAVSSGPDGIPWMKEFLSECSDCEVDFFATHYYGDCGNPVGMQSHLLDYKNQVVGDSGKKVWVTEIGAVDCPTLEMEREWIDTNVKWLDAQAWIERYAYFGYVGQKCGGVKHFLECDGSLTCLAKTYLDDEGGRDAACS